MSTVRLRRLTADFAKLSDYVRRHPRVRLIQTDGDPPERYQLEYRINSVRMVNEELQPVKTHMVEIYLPRNYPRTPPQCRMLSPVFHPNIAPHAICVGDHWSSGEPLQSIVTRIGELLAYQSYNVKSPLNGEAARWVEKNEDKMPLDKVSLLAEDKKEAQSSVATTVSAASTTSAPPQVEVIASQVVSSEPSQEPPSKPPTSEASSDNSSKEAASPKEATLRMGKVICPYCDKSFKLIETLRGRQVRCPVCAELFAIPLET